MQGFRVKWELLELEIRDNPLSRPLLRTPEHQVCVSPQGWQCGTPQWLLWAGGITHSPGLSQRRAPMAASPGTGGSEEFPSVGLVATPVSSAG